MIAFEKKNTDLIIDEVFFNNDIALITKVNAKESIFRYALKTDGEFYFIKNDII